MGWGADLASPTPIGYLGAGTAMTIQIVALRSAPGSAQRSPIGSGPKLAFTALGWLARPRVSYVHNFNLGMPVRPLPHFRALAPRWGNPIVAPAMGDVIWLKRQAVLCLWAMRCIASGNARSPSSADRE